MSHDTHHVNGTDRGIPVVRPEDVVHDHHPGGGPEDDPAPAFTGIRAGEEVNPAGSKPVDGHLIAVSRERRRSSLVAAIDSDDPIRPAWLRDRQIAGQEWARARKRVKRAAAWLAVYGWQLGLLVLWWALRGLWSCTVRTWKWAIDLDGHPVYGAAPTTEASHFDRLAVHRDFRKGTRQKWLAFLVCSCLVFAAVTWMVGYGWADLAAAMVAFALLARHGKPGEVKMWSPGVRAFEVPRLNNALVSRAIAAVSTDKIRKMIEDRPDQIWGSDFIPVNGGHKIRIILPGDAVATAYQPHEQRLASALSRPEDCAIVEPLPHITAGHFDLHIFDKPMLAGNRGPGPLAKARHTNWFGEVSCGLTRIGREHKERIRGGAWFLGGQPEAGKSSLAKVVAAHTALDPIAKLCVIDLKMSGGWLWCKPICHFFLATTPERDRGCYDQVFAFFQWLLEEATRRADFLNQLIEAGKADTDYVTEDLARRYPDKLGPITAIVDEFHRMFDDANERKDAFTELLGNVLKAVRFVAISVVGITQLAGGESIPGVIPKASRVRACLRVGQEVSFRQIFGEMGKGSFSQHGIFRFPQGVALMLSQEGSPVKVGVWYLEPRHLTEIGKRGLRLRQDVHMLTGQAAGQAVDIRVKGKTPEAAALLRHVLPLIPGCLPVGGSEDREVAWLSELERTLAERDEYAQHKASGWLAKELRARGVEPVDVGRRRGYEERPSGQRKEIGVTVQAVRSRLMELSAGDIPEPVQEPQEDAPELPEVDPELVAIATDVVVATQHVSMGMLQRKLRAGHAVCLAVMAALEEAGVVSEAAEDGSRRVLRRPESATEGPDAPQ